PDEPDEPEEPVEDGERTVYTGEAEGAHDMIYVEVTMENGEIVSIEVEHNETEDIVNPAFDELIPQIIEAQGTQGVDVISEATYSSEALFEAVEDALAKAE
ncbi:MAG: FMN-binding protein, partial [Candidatus Syntrophonatronum acetioxidans]